MGDLWFSASLRFATSVGDEAPRHEDSVIVFRAPDWEVAFTRALDFGHRMDETYENVDRVPVERRLVEVRTLDELGAVITDGREVYCRLVDPAQQVVGPDRPEDSHPGQTGV